MLVVLIANPEKPDAVAAARALAGMLEQRGARATLFTDLHCEMLGELKPELVVVLGGDGTILQVARHVACLRAPVAGINFGKLGYLAAFSFPEFQAHLDLVLSGNAPITERAMLAGAVHDADRHAKGTGPSAEPAPLPERLALNDVVINAGEPFRMIDLQVRINDRVTPRFRSDGVLVSTASGSTGYNLSAGGPLLSPNVDAMALTPICPHSLAFRAVVLPGDSVVTIKANTANPGTRVTFDGQVGSTLLAGQTLRICRAETKLRLVENPDLSHWEMLANKLRWGAGPRQR